MKSRMVLSVSCLPCDHLVSWELCLTLPLPSIMRDYVALIASCGKKMKNQTQFLLNACHFCPIVKSKTISQTVSQGLSVFM